MSTILRAMKEKLLLLSIGVAIVAFMAKGSALASARGDCTGEASTWIQKDSAIGDSNEAYDPCQFATEAKAKALGNRLHATPVSRSLFGASVSKNLRAWFLDFGVGNDGQRVLLNAGLVARMFATLGDQAESKVNEELRRLGVRRTQSHSSSGGPGITATPSQIVFGARGAEAGPLTSGSGDSLSGGSGARGVPSDQNGGVPLVVNMKKSNDEDATYKPGTAKGDPMPQSCTALTPCGVASQVSANSSNFAEVERFCSSSRDKDTRFLENLSEAIKKGAICEIQNYPYDFVTLVRYCTLTCTYNGAMVPAANAADVNGYITGLQKIALQGKKNEVTNRCNNAITGEADQIWHTCNCVPSHQARQLKGNAWYNERCLGIVEAEGGERAPASTAGATVVKPSCPAGQDLFNDKCVDACQDGYQRLVDGTCRKLPECEEWVQTPFGRSCTKYKDGES